MLADFDKIEDVYDKIKADIEGPFMTYAQQGIKNLRMNNAKEIDTKRNQLWSLCDALKEIDDNIDIDKAKLIINNVA